MSKITKQLIAVMVIMAMTLGLTTGCGDVGYDSNKTYTHDEAMAEMKAKLDQNVTVKEVQAPMYLYDLGAEEQVLSDIDTYPLTVEGDGEIDIEIAAATELSSDTPNDLLNVWAKAFNEAGIEVDGKRASVSVRKITSGEVLTYATVGDYRPDVYIPSFYGWGDMLRASGFNVIKLTDRLVGNTAGILMHKDTYDSFTAKYGEVTVGKVVEASLAGDLILAVTDPYSSTTTLNMTGVMLSCFDPSDPLSDQASQKLLEYQKTSPPMAHTTAELKDWAVNGTVDTMVMEEQAYHNTPELRSYVYTPTGARHDHPVYTFDYVSTEKQAVAREFVKYCLSSEAQQIADQKGFNLHEDYQNSGAELTGEDYLAVQRIWKQSKDGGRPVLAIFLADVSGSMRYGGALTTLKESLLSSMRYINSNNYIGLMSYSDDVYINLKPAPFDDKQRAYFAGAVNSLTDISGTATYDAVLAALNELETKGGEIPDAKKMLILLSDGEQIGGYSLRQVTDIVKGLQIPVYTIGYNLDITGDRAHDELALLSELNEATLVDAETANIANELRQLFNVNL